jgi:hypothetical protein
LHPARKIHIKGIYVDMAVVQKTVASHHHKMNGIYTSGNLKRPNMGVVKNPSAKDFIHN